MNTSSFASLPLILLWNKKYCPTSLLLRYWQWRFDTMTWGVMYCMTRKGQAPHFFLRFSFLVVLHLHPSAASVLPPARHCWPRHQGRHLGSGRGAAPSARDTARHQMKEDQSWWCPMHAVAEVISESSYRQTWVALPAWLGQPPGPWVGGSDCDSLATVN